MSLFPGLGEKRSRPVYPLALYVLIDPTVPSVLDPRGTVFYVGVTEVGFGEPWFEPIELGSPQALRRLRHLVAASRVEAIRQQGSVPVVEVLPSDPSELAEVLNSYVATVVAGGDLSGDPAEEGLRQDGVLAAGTVEFYHKVVDAPTVRLPDEELIVASRIGRPRTTVNARVLSDAASRVHGETGSVERRRLPARLLAPSVVRWVETQELLDPRDGEHLGHWVVEVRNVEVGASSSGRNERLPVITVDDDDYIVALRRHLLWAFAVGPHGGRLYSGRWEVQVFGPGVSS